MEQTVIKITYVLCAYAWSVSPFIQFIIHKREKKGGGGGGGGGGLFIGLCTLFNILTGYRKNCMFHTLMYRPNHYLCVGTDKLS